jgi:hypothetical protein
MKTPLSFFLVAAVAGTVACSDDGGKTRDTTAAGGSAGQTGVVNTGGSAGSTGGSGNLGTSGAGGGTSTGGVNLGAALTISADGAVVDTAGNTGLKGLAQVIKSPQGTVLTPGVGFKEGALCMAGTTVVVPNGDYTNFWGAEIDLDLKLTDNAAAAAAAGGGATADAGADAGGDAGPAAPPPAEVPIGWNASAVNVVGFSFKVDGAQVPIAFRFKGLPFGAPSSTTTYCNQVAAVSGDTVSIRFDQITKDCWAAGGAGVLTEPFPDNADGKLLRTISWQVPADITLPFPFDFCVSEIKPILGN